MCYERGFYLEDWREKGVACNGLPTTVLGKEHLRKNCSAFLLLLLPLQKLWCASTVRMLLFSSDISMI